MHRSAGVRLQRGQETTLVHFSKEDRSELGENNMAKRPTAHIRAQREGKVRDLFICQVCGSTEHIEGHHIIDHQYEGAANVDNIISLCHDCHSKVHKGLLSLFKF